MSKRCNSHRNRNVITECKCGCGEQVKWTYWTKLGYKTGHHRCGKKHSSKTKKKMSIIASAENNVMWKGDDVKYVALHKWIRNHLPKSDICQICRIKPPYDVACITGIYNRDFGNWQRLCRSCHMKLDFSKGIRVFHS